MVEVKIKVSKRLKKELSENKKKAEIEKAAMARAHRAYVKCGEKILGRKQSRG